MKGWFATGWNWAKDRWAWSKIEARRLGPGRVAATCGGIAGIVGAIWLIAWGPGVFLAAYAPPSSAPPLTPKEFLDLQNTYRVTYIQIVGAVVVALGAFSTLRTWQTNREGQITQRFATAIELLGAERDDKSPKIETRIGAIYALERIARDSPRDHWTIVEVLSAYIRENAPWLGRKASRAKAAPVEPRADVQAALTVLGRRNVALENGEDGAIDLRRTDLRGADLIGANLARALLARAHLEGAVLAGADLAWTSLAMTHLERADLARIIHEVS